MSVWPPLIWLALQCIGLGLNCAKGAHDGVVSLITVCGVSALLWWGNFFAPLGF